MARAWAGWHTDGVEPIATAATRDDGGHGSSRGRHGIDGGIIGISLFGLVQAGLAGTVAWAARHRRPGIARLAAVAGVAVAGSAASYLYSTGRGKRALWAELLDELSLRGEEQVLDVGCGRGAVLMLAARRLPGGQAVGADLWRRRDQSGNSRAAAERNAVAEGVADRIDLVEADARDLPFPSGSFDVVVSSLAISNIRGPPDADRRCARPCGCCVPAAACASWMTARTSTPRSCVLPDAPTSPPGGSTGGPGTASPAIT